MPTALQIKLIHVAARQVLGDDKPRYRMLLRNLGDCESSLKLSPSAFEDVMAVLEDMGFRGTGAATYWRDKVKHRGMFGNDRMARKIHALAVGCRYPLPSLCLRFSLQRTDQVERLEPREQYALIEMLKDVGEREASLVTHAAETGHDESPHGGGHDEEIPF